jgi:Fe-S cluster assembly protein SufD
MNMLQEKAIALYEVIANRYLQLSEDDSAGREEDQLRLTRASAFDRFRRLGFPSIRNEDWKYTNLNRFLKDEYTLELPVAAPVPDPALLKAATIPGLDCYRVVLVNGIWTGETHGGPLPKGLHLTKVASARQDPNLAAYFERSDWSNQHFAMLNTALFTDGLFIHVEPGTVVDKPVHVVHLYTSQYNVLVNPRHVFVVDRNAKLSLIETTLSQTGEAKLLVNSLTEVIVRNDAKVDHAVVQAAAEGARLVQHTTVRQKKQSLYNNYTFTMPGADLVRNDLQSRLEEDHTETHLYGLYLAAGNQLVDNHTLVDHQKPCCFSNELYKGVLLEQSTGVFNGKVYVHKDAQKTNAFQQNNNLVIGKKATIDSKPELEIFADDVKCSHGSTVGQFSEEALFYLRARGIGEATAKALLISAFAFDVTAKISQPALENYLNQLISQHIPSNNA